MIAAYEKFYYKGNDYDYEKRACEFMTKIGHKRVINTTQHRSPTECSVTVWYWENDPKKCEK